MPHLDFSAIITSATMVKPYTIKSPADWKIFVQCDEAMNASLKISLKRMNQSNGIEVHRIPYFFFCNVAVLPTFSCSFMDLLKLLHLYM